MSRPLAFGFFGFDIGMGFRKALLQRIGRMRVGFAAFLRPKPLDA
ncbi:hypothetical protein SAMN05443432_1111, partial [Roseovarius litoreus]